MLAEYLPILIFLAVAGALGTLLLALGFLFGPSRPDPEKLSAYECGFEAFEDTRMKFDVRYYLVAILFIVFDLEIAFLFPWAVALDSEGGSDETASEGRIVDEEGLREWVARGQEVGSHSWSHQDLTKGGFEAASAEARQSRRRLQEILDHPILDFCYPFAHHDEAARRAVAEAGYRTAYAGEPPTSDLFAVPRMMVYPGDSERRFARKLSGYYYWLSAWHRRLSRGTPR